MPANRYLILFFIFFPLLGATQVHSCRYVIAPSGLNVRSETSLSGKIVAKIPYANLVKVLDSSGVELSIRDGGKEVRGEWIRIEYYIEKGEDDFDTGQGYVFGAFLGDASEVTRIPPSSLYHYYYLRFYSILESAIEICGPYQQEQGSKFPQAFHRDKYDHTCFAYYEPFTREAIAKWKVLLDTTNWVTEEHSRIVDPEDTLRHYLEIELVDGAALRKRKVKSDYEPDLRQVQKTVPDTFRDFDTENSYMLYLDGGRDSVHIQDHHGEFTSYQRFVGRLHSLNTYLLSSDFETPQHYLIDMTTGEKKWFTEGLPCISPDGKYVLSFHYEWYPYGYEGCALGFHRFDRESKALSPVLFTNMQCWIQVGGYESVFWISNRELVIQAVPVRNFVAQGQQDKPAFAKPQYLKITIRDHD